MPRTPITDRTLDHSITVFGMTEEQWRTLHTICGNDHPGRFKAWAGSMLFAPPTPATFERARSWAAGQGLVFRTEITDTVDYGNPPPD